MSHWNSCSPFGRHNFYARTKLQHTHAQTHIYTHTKHMHKLWTWKERKKTPEERAEQSRSHSALCTTCQMQNKSQKTEPETETCCHYIPYFTTCHLCGVLRERGKDVCVENGLRISAYKILFHWQSQLQDKQTSHSAKKTISLALLLYPFKPSSCFTVAFYYCLLCFISFFCFAFYFFFLSSGDFFEFIFLAITFGICTLIKF